MRPSWRAQSEAAVETAKQDRSEQMREPTEQAKESKRSRLTALIARVEVDSRARRKHEHGAALARVLALTRCCTQVSRTVSSDGTSIQDESTKS